MGKKSKKMSSVPSPSSAWRRLGNENYAKAGGDWLSLERAAELLQKATFAYESASKTATNDEEKCFALRNLGMANWHLGRNCENRAKAAERELQPDGSMYYYKSSHRTVYNPHAMLHFYKEAMTAFSDCRPLILGYTKVYLSNIGIADNGSAIKRKTPTEFLDQLNENMKECALEALEFLTNMDYFSTFEVRIAQIERLIGACGETYYKDLSAVFRLEKAKTYHKWTITEFERSKDFKVARNRLTKCYSLLIAFRRLCPDKMAFNSFTLEHHSEVDDLFDSIKADKSTVKAMRLIDQGDTRLRAAVEKAKKEKSINSDDVYDALLEYREALVTLREEATLELLLEAEACSKMGRIYYELLKNEHQAKEYCMNAIHLANVMTPRNFAGEEWFDKATKILKQIQEEQMRQEEEALRKNREPFLKQLVKELDVLKKLSTKSAEVLLKELIKTFEPKHKIGSKALDELSKAQFSSKNKRSDIKKALSKLILLYHPDHVEVKVHGAKYHVLCEEITKVITQGCNAALGMETGEIADQDLSASSSFDEASVGPQNARIRTEKLGGAWCPKRQIRGGDIREWLEIDLRTLRVLTAIETQGRYGAGQGMEFAPGYTIEYWRPGMEEGWARYKNRSGSEVLEGNTNTFTSVVRQLDSPFVASKIRIIPWSEYTRTVCMRVELYGCDYADRLVTYSMPQGYKGIDYDVRDKSYDGFENDGTGGSKSDDPESSLSGGLGQLFDGVVGNSNFSSATSYEWIGWQQRLHGPHVDIVFEFKEVRNFSSISLHTIDLGRKEARIFSKARLHFGVQAGSYSRTLLEYHNSGDRMKDTADWIRIPTNGASTAVGKYVKLQLFFASKWLLISEVQFESVPVKGNYSDSPTTISQKEGIKSVKSSGQSTSGQHPQKVINVGFEDREGKRVESVALFTWEDMPPAYIGLIAGISIILASICAGVVLIVYLRRRRLHPTGTAPSALTTYAPAAYVPNFHNPHLQHLQHHHHHQKDMHVFYAPDGSVTNRMLVAHAGFVNSSVEGDLLLPSSPPPKSRPYGGGASPPPDYSSSSSNQITDEPSEYADPDSPMLLSSQSDIPLIPPPPPSNRRKGSFRLPTLSSFRCVGNGGAESQGSSTKELLGSINGRPSQSPSGESLHYASSDVTTPLRDAQEYDWEIGTAPSTSSMMINESMHEIPRHRLQFREKLGEGEFGEVHLCYLDTNLVAVKLLRKTSDAVSRQDFEKEMHSLSKFDHPNIVRLLGVCTKTEPWYTVVEYMEQGDLNQFLHKRQEPLGFDQVVKISEQIAGGMRYLESMNVVHRDLATRNCLVGENLTIKIADFGMARSLYSGDYYRIEGRFVLPIRWMAWECILLGKFTTKSDVWAFGVTMWEILTCARTQPFAEMTDEQVIDNLQHMYHCGQLKTYLPQPVDCAGDFYESISSCWRRDDTQRPSFHDLHSYLVERANNPQSSNS